MRVAAVAALIVIVAAAFALGRTTAGNGEADTTTPGKRHWTVDVGDQLDVPSIALFCTSYVELGDSKLLCNRTGEDPRWQVIFERERTAIGRIGDPGDQRIFPER